MDKTEFDRALNNLTPRQKEVFHKLVAGETDAQMSASLGVAEGTIRKHIQHITEKLFLSDGTKRAKRTQLINIYNRRYKPDLCQKSVLDTTDPRGNTRPFLENTETDKCAIANANQYSIGGVSKMTLPVNGIPKAIRTIVNGMPKVTRTIS